MLRLDLIITPNNYKLLGFGIKILASIEKVDKLLDEKFLETNNSILRSIL